MSSILYLVLFTHKPPILEIYEKTTHTYRHRSIGLFSQDFSMDLVKNMKPRNIGPGGMSGRVTSIAVVEANPEIMYTKQKQRTLKFLLLKKLLSTL